MDTYYKFTYTIGTTGDPYIMEYTLKDGTKKTIGIGMYKWGNLMLGSKEFFKLEKQIMDYNRFTIDLIKSSFAQYQVYVSRFLMLRLAFIPLIMAYQEQT